MMMNAVIKPGRLVVPGSPRHCKSEATASLFRKPFPMTGMLFNNTRTRPAQECL